MTERSETSGVHGIFGREEIQEVLEDRFYRSPEEARLPRRRARAKKADHYEVICISLYKEDLARLDEKVKQLKESGHRKMSRSALIRYALDSVDLGALPRGY